MKEKIITRYSIRNVDDELNQWSIGWVVAIDDVLLLFSYNLTLITKTT